MNVSSSSSPTTSTSTSPQVDVIKKAQDVQAQEILKMLESSAQQSKDMTAQKTGMGNSINLTA